MPYELIFTSAQRGVDIGRSGYCTVAHTREMSQDLILALEKASAYHHVGSGPGSNPTVYCYRMLEIRGETFFVISQIRDAGLDYTNRSNYLAHHLVLDSREIENLPSPAAILLHWDGWITDWGNKQPGLLQPTRFTQSNLNQLPKQQGRAQTWEAKTHNAANAAGLMEYPPSQPISWMCNVGEEKEMVQLFAEALQLADPTGQSFIEAWSYTFTTFLQQGDSPEQFVWRGVVPGTPAFQLAQQSGQPPLSLTQLQDPGNARSEFAKTGRPQAQVEKTREVPRPAPTDSPAVAGSDPAISPLQPQTSARKKRRKRAVGQAAPAKVGRRKLVDSSRKWIYIGGGVIAVCVLGVLILGATVFFGSDDEPDPNGQLAKKPGEGTNNPAEGNPGSNGEKGGVDIGALLGGNGNGKGGTETGPDPKPVTTAPANPQLYEFIANHRVYLVPTTGGQAEFGEDDPKMKNPPLETFFKALKVHNKANFTKSENPDPFEAATYSIGPDPMKLKGVRRIPYDSTGGTQAKPVQYDLEAITALASGLNPASKPAGIYFEFPGDKRQWIHIKSKGFEPFYMVPVERGRYPALINLKVAEGIEFDEESMIAKVDPEIKRAIGKLLQQNNASQKIMLRAGAPLRKWGAAHGNIMDTIDFSKAYLQPRLAQAKAKVNQLNHFTTWTDKAIATLFPAAKDVADAKRKAENPGGNNPRAAEWREAVKAKKEAYDKADKAMKHLGGYNFFGGKTLDQIGPMSLSVNDRFLNTFKAEATYPPGLNGFKAPASQHMTQACENYATARDEVRRLELENGKLKQRLTALQDAVKQQQAAFANISRPYLTKGSPVPGLDVFKESLAADAGQILLGKKTFAAVSKDWEGKKAEMPKEAKADLAKWATQEHHKAEWGKFKKHKIFYLAGTLGGVGSPVVVSLVQFNQ